MIQGFNLTITGNTDYLMNTIVSPYEIPNYGNASYYLNWRYAGEATGYNITNGYSYSVITFDTGKTTATDEVKVIPCGYYDIASYYGMTIYENENIIVNIVSGSTILSKIIFTPQLCNGNDLYFIKYINKWGMWDRFYFTGKKDESISYDYEIYKYNKVDYSTMTYNTSDGTYHRYNTQGKGKIILNTGWVNENKNAQLEELLLSEIILINDLPYMITDKDVRYQTTRWDKAINYTLNLEAAYDKINQVI